MGATNSDDLGELDAIDETLISLGDQPESPLYFCMFLIAAPILMYEYFFLLAKFNIFLEWARHL